MRVLEGASRRDYKSTPGSIFSLCWIPGERRQNTQPFLKKKNNTHEIFFLWLLLLWLLPQPLVVTKFCLSRLSLIDICFKETGYILLGSLASDEQLTQLTPLFSSLLRCLFLTSAVVLPLPPLGVPWWGSMVCRVGLWRTPWHGSEIGHALHIWELNSNKPHLEDKPSQVANSSFSSKWPQ